MRKETRVDRYLRHLERELRDLEPAARAAAMAEVRTQIENLKTQGRSGADIVRELGPFKLTAKSYSKGRDTHAPRTSWLRWVAVATVAFFAAVFIGGLSLIWRLSPLKDGAGTGWWGGTLKIDDRSGHIRPGDSVVAPAVFEGERVTGTENLARSKVTKVRIPFNTGKLEINPGEPDVLSWDCAAPRHENPRVTTGAGVLTLDLDALNVARCAIGVPAGIAVEVRGVNGHMEVRKPAGALDVQLSNGRVNIKIDPTRAYDFDVRVKNGLQDFFPRSGNPKAVKVRVNVTNGTVKKE